MNWPEPWRHLGFRCDAGGAGAFRIHLSRAKSQKAFCQFHSGSKVRSDIRPHDQLVCNRLDDLHDPVSHIVLLPHPHQTEIGQLLHIFGDRAAIALVLLTVSVLT
jgi:hypothetical protein